MLSFILQIFNNVISGDFETCSQGQLPNKIPSTLFNMTLVHQSASHLLPGMSHVMCLCCNAAIPGIPPWNTQIGPHRMGSRLQNKTTFLRQVLTKKYCAALYTVSGAWMGKRQHTASAKETEAKYYSSRLSELEGVSTHCS